MSKIRMAATKNLEGTSLHFQVTNFDSDHEADPPPSEDYPVEFSKLPPCLVREPNGRLHLTDLDGMLCGRMLHCLSHDVAYSRLLRHETMTTTLLDRT